MGRNKQVSDEAVLEAAKAVFVEQGFGASTREVARRAGISEAVLYQRYKNGSPPESVGETVQS
jgi:AcrR family transcriptional regulator